VKEILFTLKDILNAKRLSPEVRLGYNASGDLVEIRKVINGVTYKREVDDPDVTDKTVSKWVTYGAWKEV